MEEKVFDLPLKEEDMRKLKLGDIIYLRGTIYTARDMAHLKIQELYEKGEDLPVDFQGAVIFHAGPVVKEKDGKWELVVIGPTTSSRMEPYSELVGQLGVKAIVGKGGMMEETSKNAARFGYVYLQAPPGCGVTTTLGFEEIEGVEWPELAMPEALWKIRAKKFGPLVVSMDSHGNSIYKEIKEKGLEYIENL